MEEKSLEIYHSSVSKNSEIPLIGGISAGFPSPAEDFLDSRIDLNKELVPNPSSTFYGRVSGDSMQDLGIHDGDLLVIDKSKQVTNGKVAVCFIDGEFTLKTIKMEKNYCWLMPANSKYKPILVTKENDFVVWGVVTYVVKAF